jgi:hypothetical protein
MQKGILRECLRDALKNVANHDQYKHYIHYSYAIVGNAIWCVGKNKSDTPLIHFGYTQRVPDPKIHSELDAYKKLRKMLPIAKTEWELVNVRVNRSGEMKISKPCEVCQEWLRSIGCKRVTYTTETGWETWE